LDYSLLRNGLNDFLLSSPWWQSINEQAGIQSGRVDMPYTRQYVGTTPLVYNIQQMVFWGLSPVPGLVVCAGFLVGLWNALRRRPAEILLLAGALPYLATILTLEAKWMRYTLPLVPIFCLLGAAMLVRGIAWERRTRASKYGLASLGPALLRLRYNAFAVLTGVAVGAAFLWSVAFMNIYSQDHSREQASQWMYDNIPIGSRHSGEAWDDMLPLGPPEIYGKSQPPSGGYFGPDVTFDMYPDRTPADALTYVREQMAQTDYIVLASTRLYGSLPHLPWRYPVQTRFYDLLFQGKLGYVKVHTSQVTPELFGIRFDDQSADESFTVYDHPRVDIFKKVTTLTEDQLRTLFSTALNRPLGEYSMDRHGSVTDSKSLSYDQAVSTLPDVGDYSWNPLAQEDTQWIAVLLWLLAIYVIGFAALPLVFAVCRNLPDRGYPVAKVAGLLLVSWATWMVASARVLPFTVWTVLLMLGLLATVGLLCWKAGVNRDVRAFFREKKSLVLFYEGIFLLAFAVFLFIRVLDPDLWQPWNGGEKPMEFGFLNATLRSPWMPPLDPFFSGGYINYYYYGYFVVACMIKLVGVQPAVAFNLAIPLLYGLAMSGAASVGYNLVAWSRRSRRSRLSPHPVSRAGLVFAALSGVLTLVIGNLHALYQFLSMQVPQAAVAVTSTLARIGFSSAALSPSYGKFEYWQPRSIIPGTINEFPIWTYLFADLHPHLIDMPFALLALVLALNLAFARRGGYETTPTSRSSKSTIGQELRDGLAYLWGPGWRGFASFGLLAIVLGALAVTNSWDFPTFAALAAGGALIALLRLRRASPLDAANDDYAVQTADAPGPGITTYGGAVISVAALAGASLLFYLPFFLSFKAFYTDILPLIDGGTLEASSALMRRTSLSDFLLFWFMFIFISASFLLYRLWKFPWGDAFSDLGHLLVPGKGQPAQRKLAESGAWSSTRLFPRRGLLTPVIAAPGAATTATWAFSSESPPRGSLPALSGDAVENNVDIEVANGSHPGRAVEAPDSEGATGDEPSEPELTNSGPHGNGALGIRYETGAEANGSGLPSYVEPQRSVAPSADNWLAAGATAVTPVSAAVRTRIYPGVLPLWTGLLLLGSTLALTVLQIATGQYLLALLIALLGGIAATTLTGSRGASALFTGALLVAALAATMGVELVYLADHLRSGDSYRMNTVFKFYVQAWVLFGTGGAAAVYYILFGLRDLRVRRSAPVSITESAPAYPLADEPAEVVSNGHGLVQVAAGEAGGGPSGEELMPVRDAEETDNWLVWSSPDITPSTLAPSDLLLPSNTQGVAETRVMATEVREPEPEFRPGMRLVPLRLAWLVAFVLLFIGSLFFPLLGTQARVTDRFPTSPPVGTLNGMKYMTVGTFTTDAAPFPIVLKYDYEAINWMNQNVHRTKVIAEVSLGYYREHGMRVASNTGFPMVVGGLHQGEQRAGVYDRLVGDRGGDMNEFFTTTDVQRALILMSKYDIDYIYIGQLEVARAGDGIAKFAQMSDPKVAILKQVFNNGDTGGKGTTIYQVVKDARTITGAPVANSGIPGISITPVPTPTRTPAPTPPVDDPALKALIADVAAKPTDRETRLRLVEWYQQNKYYTEAARELETIVAQDPQNIAVRHMLGDAYQSADQPDLALRAWEEARDVDPGNPATHNKLGIAYMERQRTDDALKEFQAATGADQNFIEGWFHMGEAYELKGDKGKARESYQAAIDKSTDQNAWADMARQRLGKIK
ncbi:MAG TPA: DUF2298 domain-containing protein, partial [Chloroflexia bacterium]|nr:DUF2298 domain-containing protein [Chloroflexia bacterium]